MDTKQTSDEILKTFGVRPSALFEFVLAMAIAQRSDSKSFMQDVVFLLDALSEDANFPASDNSIELARKEIANFQSTLNLCLKHAASIPRLN